MKKLSKIYTLMLAALVVAGLASCNKEQSLEPDDSVLLATSIEVISSTPTSDAVFAVDVCSRNSKKDSVAFSTLPASVATYLTANYAGYTVKKSFKITTSAGAADGFAVIVIYNGKPVAIRFDASGNFIKVLEQRERGDLKGKGWRHGGRFEHRDGQHRDSIALSALPTPIKGYLNTNYAGDTLLHARAGKDGSIIVISKNNGLFATVFTSAGVFVKRDSLPAHPGRPTIVSVTDLPAKASAYLISTFPGYVFNKAFALKINNAVHGYAVIIDVNATRYAVQFDASGNFIKSKVIR